MRLILKSDVEILMPSGKRDWASNPTSEPWSKVDWVFGSICGRSFGVFIDFQNQTGHCRPMRNLDLVRSTKGVGEEGF